jgi:sugar phosphate isomerase/epimerase
VTNLRIGVQTRSLRQPLRRALETAARLGADGVEIDARSELIPAELSETGLRQFRKLLDDYRLQVSAVAFPTRRGYDVPDDLERRIAATQAAMKLAYNLGGNVVVNRIGRVPADKDHANSARLTEALAALAAYGNHVGARLAALPGAEPPSDLARLIAGLPEGSIGVDFHPGALIQNGFSPADALDDLGPHVLHVHAADAVRSAGEVSGSEVDLGRGMADLPALVASLETRFNYRGWITIERHGTADPVTAIANAVEYLRSL